MIGIALIVLGLFQTGMGVAEERIENILNPSFLNKTSVGIRYSPSFQERGRDLLEVPKLLNSNSNSNNRGGEINVETIISEWVGGALGATFLVLILYKSELQRVGEEPGMFEVFVLFPWWGISTIGATVGACFMGEHLEKKRSFMAFLNSAIGGAIFSMISILSFTHPPYEEGDILYVGMGAGFGAAMGYYDTSKF